MKRTEEEIRKLAQEIGYSETLGQAMDEYKDGLDDDWIRQPDYAKTAMEMSVYLDFVSDILRDEIDVNHQREMAKINARFWPMMGIIFVVFALVQFIVWLVMT